MRPSFEAEAAKLAQIPDDDDDDGGVESALLKLEGKFEQRKSDLSASSLVQVAPISLPQRVDAAPIDVLAGPSGPSDDMFDDDESDDTDRNRSLRTTSPDSATFRLISAGASEMSYSGAETRSLPASENRSSSSISRLTRLRRVTA